MLLPADKQWLQEQFDQLRQDHNKILNRINDLQVAVTPELETAILKSLELAKTLDQKVPDTSVPPSPHKSTQGASTMTQQEALDAMNATNATLVKVSNETDALLREIDNLKQQLADAGGPGGTITPELAAAVNAVSTRATAIDQLVPDVTQPEKAGK